MKSNLTNKLNKHERNILYRIYKGKFIGDGNLFDLGWARSEYREQFDTAEVEQIIEHLVELGYITKKDNGGFSIPNVRKLQEIKKIFRNQRAWDWFWNKIKHLGFLWKLIRNF